MKCLIIVQNYPPEIGPVRYTFDLANALNVSGNEISVITGFPNYPSGNKYPGFEHNGISISNEKGIEVVRVPVLRASNSQPIKRILGFITFVLASLPQVVRRKNIDLIIVSVPPFTDIFLAIFSKLFFRIPFITVLRDIEPHDSFFLRGMNKSGAVNWFIRLLSKTYNAADCIVMVDQDQARIINSLGVKIQRDELITRPVAFNNINFNLEEKADQPNPKKIKGVYVGTFGKRHSLPQLLIALLSDKIAGLPIEFEFIGEGEEGIQCRNLVNSSENKNVWINPPVAFENVPNILGQADFLLYSENVEIRMSTLGAKFLEYLASGKPVLVIGNSPAGDIVNKVKNGWYVSSYNIDYLYKGLQKMVAERMNFKEIGLRGKQFISEYEKKNNFSEKWLNLCQSIIENVSR